MDNWVIPPIVGESDSRLLLTMTDMTMLGVARWQELHNEFGYVGQIPGYGYTKVSDRGLWIHDSQGTLNRSVVPLLPGRLSRTRMLLARLVSTIELAG